MNGNQLNYAVTTWTVGYLVREIPSNILLTRIRPSIWLPACEVQSVSFSHLLYLLILLRSSGQYLLCCCLDAIMYLKYMPCGS
jgi:hypothetical protein